MDDNGTEGKVRTIIVEDKKERSKGLGIAGFVLSLLGLIFCWLPFYNVILWILGLVFSFIAMFKSARGMAITGLILSSVTVTLYIFMAILILAS